MSKTHDQHIVSHIITSVKRMPFFVDGSNAACPAAGINPGPANNGYSSSKHRFLLFCFRKNRNCTNKHLPAKI